MRRLTLVFAAALLLDVLAASGCQRRERIRLEPTEESTKLASTVHMADPQASAQLLRGFHQVEQNSWRWTMSSFSVALKPPPGATKSGAKLLVHLSIPDAIIQRLRETRLTASIRGSQIGWASYSSSGEFTFSADIPASLIGDEAVTVDFSLDRFLSAGTVDTRELGIIVSSVGLDPK